MDYQVARENMVQNQIRAWYVMDQKILNLFEITPREFFVPIPYKELAYVDTSIPLWHGQTMMPPAEEGRILQALKLHDQEKVLVLGIDSGFFVTLIAKLVHQVYYVVNEVDSLNKVKPKILEQGLKNVLFSTGNLNEGWSEHVPFDVIVILGSLLSLPLDLINHLTMEGRLFAVVGNPPTMEATLVVRKTTTDWTQQKLFETERPRFVHELEKVHFDF